MSTNSHDEELAEIQRAIMELSQLITRVNSPPPSIHGPGSSSEYSETSPVGLAREDSLSMSPAPHGSSKVRQDDPYEDPAKVAERERVRGENRVRKKRWRESNQDRNKDNDLRCRVTKRGNKIWGPEDSEEKRVWMKNEFFRRREKREAKERARAADETGLNMGAGSSRVFQAYNSSPSPMPTISTSLIFSNLQTSFSHRQAEETRVVLQDLVSLLPSLNTIPQNLEAAESQGLQTAGNNQGQPTNADGEPDLSDEDIERLIVESGFSPDELLSRSMESEAPIISEPSRSSTAQSEDGSIRGLMDDDSELSWSIEQINALLELLTGIMALDEPANTSSPHSINLPSYYGVADPTQDHIAALTSNWRDCQISSIPLVDTASRGTKRCSPDDPSPLSKRTCKPPSSCNSENMNRPLMKPPPYCPASRPPPINVPTGPESAIASHAKSNEHEKKIKSMGFPPLMAGMKPK